jgi:hypothetical protein
MDASGADFNNYCADYCIYKFPGEKRSYISHLYFNGKTFVFLLFPGDKAGHEVHPQQQRHDQEGICTKIYVSSIQYFIFLYYFCYFPDCAAWCHVYI